VHIYAKLFKNFSSHVTMVTPPFPKKIQGIISGLTIFYQIWSP